MWREDIIKRIEKIEKDVSDLKKDLKFPPMTAEPNFTQKIKKLVIFCFNFAITFLTLWRNKIS